MLEPLLQCNGCMVEGPLHGCVVAEQQRVIKNIRPADDSHAHYAHAAGACLLALLLVAYSSTCSPALACPHGTCLAAAHCILHILSALARC